MSDPIKQIQQQAQQAKTKVQTWKTQQSKTVETEAEKLRRKQTKAGSSIEKQSQETLEEIRKQETRAKRAKEIPGVTIARPKAGLAEEVEKTRSEAIQKVTKGKKELKKAKEKALKEITIAAEESLADIDKQEQLAVTEFKKFAADNVKLDYINPETKENEWIDEDTFKDLSKDDQKLIVKVGIIEFNKIKEKEQKDFKKENVQLDYINPDTGEHEWIDEEAYDAITDKKAKKILNTKGIDAYNEYIGDEQKSVYDSYSKYPKVQAAIDAEGLGVLDLSDLTPEKQFEQYQVWGMIPEDATFAGISSTGDITYNTPPDGNNVQIDYEDEWVNENWYNDLNKDEQKELNEIGQKAYMKKRYVELKYINPTTGEKELVDKDWYYSLTSTQKVEVSNEGTQAYFSKYYTTLNYINPKTGEHEMVDKEWWNNLPTDTADDRIRRQFLSDNGLKAWQKEYYVQIGNIDEYVTREFYNNIENETIDGKIRQQYLISNGLTAYYDKYYVALKKTGELIPRVSYTDMEGNFITGYEDMTTENQGILQAQGVAAFNASQQQITDEADTEAIEFNKNHYVIGDKAITNEEWKQLDPAYQAIAIAQGFDAMEAEMAKDKKEFEDKYIKLDFEEEWIPKESYTDENGNEITGYNDLDKEQQDYIKANGIAKFNEKYAGGTSETYEAAEARLLELSKDQQQFAIRTGLGGYTSKTWSELTDDEKKRVLDDFIVRFPPEMFGEDGMQYIIDANWNFQVQHYLLPTVAMIPVVGTVYFWNDMSPNWRAFSIVTDLLAFSGLILKGLNTIKTAINPVGTAMTSLLSQQAKVSKGIVSNIKAMFGNNLADAYKATEAARIKYLQKLSEVAQIEYRLNTPSSIAGHITTAERTALKNSLTQARLEAVALEQTLRGTGKTFVTAASGQVGFDSPEMLRILQGMPDDLVRSSKSIIEGITTSNKSIKQLKVDVKTAQEVLDTAINKGQGGKKITWTRELENFNKAQASLDQALRGNIWEMQQKLIQARSELELARINDDYYHTAATKKTKTDATTKAASAEQTLAQALKTAEVEWGKGGALATNYQDIFKAPAPGGGGSGGSAVPIITTELTPAVSSATFNVPVNIPIAPQVTIPSMTGAVVKTIIPTVVSDAENIPQVTSTTGVESLPTIESVVLVQPTISVAAITDVVSKALPAMLSKLALSTSAISQSQASTIIEAITNTAALAATQALTQGLTTTQIKAAAKVSIASSIKTIPQSEIKTSILPLTDTMVSTAIKAATATQAKVATTIATTVATEVKPLPKPGKFFRLPKIKLPDGTEHQMTEEEFASAVGWKQGIMYIMIFKPYKQNNVTFTRKPIPGIPYKEGARSAYESIRKLKDGKLPAKVKIDLGIMDVIIKTGKKGRGKPKLKFKRDTDQINKGISTAR